MNPAADPLRRQWRLEGYDGKERVHRSLCIGDHALDLAMRKLEDRGLRIVVGPA